MILMNQIISQSAQSNNISIDSSFSTYKTEELTKVFLHPFRSKENVKQIKHLTQKMECMPENFMRRTLEATTMSAKNYLNIPLFRHFKS